MVAFLQGLGIGEPIESYATQYAAVATDMATGREIWLQSGPIHEAIRASIALPGILSPARMHGKWLLDGGLCNPIPVSVCRALGADVIIAVNLNGELLGRRFSERTKAALQAAKARGTKLGSPIAAETVEKRAARSRYASEANAKTRKVIADIRASGVTTWAAIGKALEARGRTHSSWPRSMAAGAGIQTAGGLAEFCREQPRRRRHVVDTSSPRPAIFGRPALA